MRALLLIALAGGLPGPAAAQEGRRAHAVRTDHEIHIDGRLDEAEWAGARFVSDFLQKEPDEGAPATQKTEVAFVYDDDALYVGARMFADDVRAIQNVMTRRDDSGSAERIIVSFDTYLDKRTAYSFAVTAAGVRVDWYHYEDSEYRRDHSYNPVWTASVQLYDDRWEAEMRIPFSQLRFPDTEVQHWGVNLNRFVPDRSEDDFWIVVPRKKSAWSSMFAPLEGIVGVRPPLRLEVVPYLAGELRLTEGPARDMEDPLRDAFEPTGRIGIDVKAGIGPNLTLDGTVFPDFGQVEADPAEVNLSDFETFFDERRPFFVEGKKLLAGGGPAYYYSRRIGAPPRASAEGDFVRAPRSSRILGAAKLTGRLRTGTSIGGVVAVTAAESATVSDAGVERRVRVAPVTGYGIARVQQDFGEHGSTAGASFTAVQRGTGLEADLARQAIAGGGDWKLRLGEGEYELGGHLGFSHVAGSPEAIAPIQTSSAHYFQRPDQGHIEFDATRTSLSGYTGALTLEKISGEHWLWNAGILTESPGFEINDLGRLNAADDTDLWASFRYRETQPVGPFHDFAIGLTGNAGWNFGGIHQFGSMKLFGNAVFRNFWSGWADFTRWLPAQSDSMTRGGPLMRSAGGWQAQAGFQSIWSKPTRVSAWVLVSGDDTGGWGAFTGARLRVQLGNHVTLSLEPRFERSHVSRQYVAALGDGPSETFGTRYVFARGHRATVALPIRVLVGITPDLTLEVYAEPFAASGDFFEYGELVRAGGSDLHTYGSGGTTLIEVDTTYTVTDGRETFTFTGLDFNFRSFRSNVVLRWEWRAGSTLFFVWQQDRSRSSSGGDLLGPGAIGEAIGSAGEHTFALKLSYWWG